MNTTAAAGHQTSMPFWTCLVPAPFHISQTKKVSKVICHPSRLKMDSSAADLHVKQYSWGPHESATQTASRSIQPFCTGHPYTHRHTDHATCDNRLNVCTACRRCSLTISMKSLRDPLPATNYTL